MTPRGKGGGVSRSGKSPAKSIATAGIRPIHPLKGPISSTTTSAVRYTGITFNGEIYDYQGLRDKLIAEGHVFRSHSDTEVLLHLYDRDGPDMVQRLRGRYAFAI